MGQLEALTALALGRGHYEDELIWDTGAGEHIEQGYNYRGHPIRPETKRRERDHIRAANEVMQVTGVVEDAVTARSKSKQEELDKQFETFIAFRLMEVGRTCFQTGVWGALGLRRRILLYRPYASMKIATIIKLERQKHSLSRLFISGLPMALLPHTSYYLMLAIKTFIDFLFGPDLDQRSAILFYTNFLTHGIVEIAFISLKMQFQVYSILQQLHLLPESKLFPNFLSLIPFTTTSIFQFNPKNTTNIWLRLYSWVGAFSLTIAPLLVIRGYELIAREISGYFYPLIYAGLPRPTVTVSGLSLSDVLFNDEENENIHDRPSDWISLPTASWARDPSEIEALTQNFGREGSDEEDDEMNNAQLISFDVEPNESSDTVRGPWSAELRSANEPKPAGATRYRMTGLTVLPIILATEMITDAIVDILLIPAETLMVRVVSSAYRASFGLVKSHDHYGIGLRPHGLVNLFFVWTLQLTISGAIWGGLTMCTNFYITRQKKNLIKNTRSWATDINR